MKKLYQEEKYKFLSIKRSRKALERRKVIERRKKHLRRLLQGKPRIHHKDIIARIKYKNVKAPENFSLLTNTEETIDFLNRIEAYFNNRREVFVVLKNVKYIDPSAITVLLSLMYKFKVARINFNGDFPEDVDVRNTIEESQFFQKLLSPISQNMGNDYTMTKNNQIFARANTMVISEMGEKIMEEATKTIWGERRICKGLQKTLIELMHNTNNHASKSENNQEHWWLSVNHDKENKKVDFYFVDYGQGILRSLERKSNPNIWNNFWDNFKKLVDLGSEEKVIECLLKGEHWSPEQRIQPYYRGKGLPSIRESIDRKQISNLQIISNNTRSDVDLKSFVRLSKNFNGTFIHWRLEKNNENKVWNI